MSVSLPMSLSLSLSLSVSVSVSVSVSGVLNETLVKSTRVACRQCPAVRIIFTSDSPDCVRKRLFAHSLAHASECAEKRLRKRFGMRFDLAIA